MEQIFALLIAFEIKHFLADYPLQTNYMLQKFRGGWEGLAPLASHCLVHGTLTAAICAYIDPSFVWLGLVDVVAHFVVDDVKASLGSKNPKERQFWAHLGLDQAAHHICHFAYIYVMVS